MEEARARFIPELKRADIVRYSPSARIYESLIALYDSGAAVDFNQLYSRLEQPDRERLSNTFLTEVHEYSLEHGDECLKSLESTYRKGQLAQLKARVAEAERAGNLMEALRLNQELEGMTKR